MLRTKSLIKISLFTAVICILSLVRIPVLPVPVSLTFFAVNTIILISDLRISFISLLLYLVLGLIGLPVFSQGGGIGYVFNMSFGYLLGFLIAPLISGFFTKKINLNEFKKNMMLSGINILTVYFFGVLYAYFLSYIYLGITMDIKYLITYYVLIFIPSDIFFAYLSVKISGRLKRIVK